MVERIKYRKELFDPEDLEHGKRIVLTPEKDEDLEKKFKEETDFLINFIKVNCTIEPHFEVLDFGCGMGRLSKPLIETFGCEVLGIDISQKMLDLAETYCNSDRFYTATVLNEDETIDFAIASLVLQHVEHPKKEIARIYKAMKPGATLLLFNEFHRLLPTGVDENRYIKWEDDGISIQGLVAAIFKFQGYYDYMGRGNFLSIWTKP